MFRRSSNLRRLFGDYVSPEAIGDLLKEASPAEAPLAGTLGFIWIWFTEAQVGGPEIGSVIDRANASGGLIEIFPPVAAFWFGRWEGEAPADLAKLVEDLKPFTSDGAKLIKGTTSGAMKNIGSEGRWNYTVLSPDRAAILRQLAGSAAGSVNTFESNALDDPCIDLPDPNPYPPIEAAL